MRIETSAPPVASTPTIDELRDRARYIKEQLYRANRAYLATGDQRHLSRQMQLSIDYERALHQVRKRLAE